MQPGWFTVRASDGFNSQMVRWEAVAGKSGREVEVALSGNLVPLEGRVVDADGKPVEGAQVRVTSAHPPTHDQDMTVEDFQFPPLPSVRGRVLDPEGRGAGDASLTFEQGERRVSGDVDTEGRFTTHLVDGAWTVKAEHEGLGSAATTVTVAGSPADVPDLRLVRIVAVSGYVRGFAPGEVPLVQASSEDGVWVRGVFAEQDHRFQLPDLWPGTWTLTAMLDERQDSTQVRILPGDTAVHVDVSFGED